MCFLGKLTALIADAGGADTVGTWGLQPLDQAGVISWAPVVYLQSTILCLGCRWETRYHILSFLSYLRWLPFVILKRRARRFGGPSLDLMLQVDRDALQSHAYRWQCGCICPARFATVFASDLLHSSGAVAHFPHPRPVHKVGVPSAASPKYIITTYYRKYYCITYRGVCISLLFPLFFIVSVMVCDMSIKHDMISPKSVKQLHIRSSPK